MLLDSRLSPLKLFMAGLSLKPISSDDALIAFDHIPDTTATSTVSLELSIIYITCQLSRLNCSTSCYISLTLIKFHNDSHLHVYITAKSPCT